MDPLWRPTNGDDEKRLSEFLTRMFSANAGLVSSSMLRWKYWVPREDWPEPRSFCMERDGRIIAHVGLWPVTVQNGTKRERGVHAMDWAADPHARGAGWALIKNLTRTFDFVYGIGGEEITRAILPKLGFRTVAEALTWARPASCAIARARCVLPLLIVEQRSWARPSDKSAASPISHGTARASYRAMRDAAASI